MVDQEPKFHRDKEGKIKLIIDTFVSLIIQKGYTNVSTNLVAKEAGLSIGTIYNYFKSKEDILQAAFQGTMEDFIDFSEAIKILATYDYTSTKMLVSKYLASHKEYYQLHKAQDQAIAINQDIFQDYQKNIDSYIQMFSEQARQNDARLAKIPAETISKVLKLSINLLDTLVHQHLFRVSFFDNDEELVEYITKLFIFTLKLYLKE